MKNERDAENFIDSDRVIEAKIERDREKNAAEFEKKRLRSLRVTTAEKQTRSFKVWFTLQSFTLSCPFDASWKDYHAFLATTGHAPNPSAILLRRVPDLGFIPGNVQWGQWYETICN